MFPSWSWLVNLLSGTSRRVHANHRKNFELMDYVITQHEERRGSGRVGQEDEDLVAVLLRLQKEDGLGVALTMGIIKAVILVSSINYQFIFSIWVKINQPHIESIIGSATTLHWAMSELMRNPNVMNKAHADVRNVLNGKPTVTENDLAQLNYLKLVIKETLRLHPPGPLLIRRESMESCKILGYDVPKGTVVFVNPWVSAETLSTGEEMLRSSSRRDLSVARSTF